MFRDLFTFFKKCVPLSTTFIIASNVSFVHMFFLVFEDTWFNCGDDLCFVGQEQGEDFPC